jgi:hypothetical protein
MDGTGYPCGRRDPAPLARLLAVCDTYAALVSPRPHRPALDTRAALAEVILMARRGVLDPDRVDELSKITFYPVGSAVVLDDGTVGVVVAANAPAADAHRASRPVVALVADAEGRPVPGPKVVDLAGDDSRAVVRALPADSRRDLLGSVCPQFA